MVQISGELGSHFWDHFNIPLVSVTGNTETTVQAGATASGVDLDTVFVRPRGVNTLLELSPAGTPFDDLILCPDGKDVDIDWKNLPAPDPNAPGCRATSISSNTPQKRLDEENPKNGSQADGRGQVSKSNHPYFSWAIHTLRCIPTCTTSNGITGLNFVYSAKVPSILGTSWNDYHFYNRTHVGDQNQTVTCPNGGTHVRNLSIGTGYGRIGEVLIDGGPMYVVWERFTTNGCNSYLSNQDAPPEAALFMNMSKSGTSTWTAKVWRGYWAYVFNESTTWPEATYAEMGQELWARNGDKHNIRIPMNFEHKFQINTSADGNKPWWNGVLASPIFGASGTVSDPPFNVMDSIPGDYTSISTEANQ